MNAPLIIIDLRYEQDVVLTRQRARQIAALLGFSRQEQTGFATAVSEIARNAHRYAGGGKVEFAVQELPQSNGRIEAAIVVTVRDQGPGIRNLDEIFAGRYRSETGMGLGLIGTRRLSDSFDIQTAPGLGTTVTIGKKLPPRAGVLTQQRLTTVAAELSAAAPQGPLQEMQLQNKELLLAMEELQARNADVTRLNSELGETNRGVLALYKELDDKADSFQKVSEIKSRFLSDMSHELRTPLNAVISLSGLLLDQVDGPLTHEQEKQVRFIRKSAESLTEMVNDLLDLAKIEAGKIDVRISEFRVADLLSALRGMFRPMMQNQSAVELIVEDAGGVERLWSDEAKLNQILRNFLSNAMKFTERGQIRIRCEAVDPGRVRFSVEDTGIGISPQDQARVFEDFAQVDGPVQRRVRGTGLGLPLTRKLAALLGGEVSLQSEAGKGSTFSVTIPVTCPRGDGAADEGTQSEEIMHHG